MDTLRKARESFRALIEGAGLDPKDTVAVRPLQPEEAIGSRVDDSFVIKKGKERVIEALFQGHRGQAFTDRPSPWEGTLGDLFGLDLDSVRNRAIFVAALNAVLAALGKARGTVHCRDEDPMRCGPEIAGRLLERFGPIRVGLVGLQPAILENLVSRFGSSRVSVVDLNPENIGKVRFGVEVWDGDRELDRLTASCEVGLATGSSVVNGTLDGIRSRFQAEGKPLILFGNTISGVAELLGLERLCPFGSPG